MSFILDALKKSELERQRQAIPGLVESGIARPRARLPMWAIALCALLGVNLVVLLVVLMRGWLAPPPGRARAEAQTQALRGKPTAAADGAANDAPDQPFSPLDAPPVYAPEIPVPAAGASATEPAPLPREPSGAGNSGTHLPHRRDPVLTNEDYKTEDEEVLPSINEINLTGAQALPELHLDVHVYATKSAERFVFINMRKYHEGATLQEGPTVERIRRDGVVLTYNGLKFLLPRQ